MSNLKFITGHSGSGKTEFCVNYAVRNRKDNIYNVVTIADVDIINPYFRSREKKELFDSLSINVIGTSSTFGNIQADMPMLPRELAGAMGNQKEDELMIFDVGGDGAGAKVLARFTEDIKKREYDMYVVINANRPQTAKCEDAVSYIIDIERQSALTVNGIINTTHLLRETSLSDILRGQALCEEISDKTNLPIIYNVVPYFLEEEIKEVVKKPFILEELYMRPIWL